jgi:hypothetical protein
MGREHVTRSKGGKGNEMPYSVPGMPGKKAALKAKPAPAPKLDPVAPKVFYGTTPRSQHPARPQTPTDHASHSSRKGKGKAHDIISVDAESDDDDSIEEANFENTSARASAQRPSMARGRETHNVRDEDEDEPVILEAQTAAGNKTRGMAKQKKAGGKGGLVSLCSNVA